VSASGCRYPADQTRRWRARRPGRQRPTHGLRRRWTEISVSVPNGQISHVRDVAV